MIFLYFETFFQGILLFSLYGKLLRSFVYVIIYCLDAGITISMSVFDGLDPYICRRKMEKTRSMGEELDGRVLISRQSRQYSFIDNMIKVIFAYLYPNLACKQLCFPPRKDIYTRNESTVNILFFVAFSYCTFYKISFDCCIFRKFCPSEQRGDHHCSRK